MDCWALLLLLYDIELRWWWKEIRWRRVVFMCWRTVSRQKKWEKVQTSFRWEGENNLAMILFGMPNGHPSFEHCVHLTAKEKEKSVQLICFIPSRTSIRKVKKGKKTKGRESAVHSYASRCIVSTSVSCLFPGVKWFLETDLARRKKKHTIFQQRI